eukprot:2546804-Rhodomonas_salina.1
MTTLGTSETVLLCLPIADQKLFLVDSSREFEIGCVCRPGLRGAERTEEQAAQGNVVVREGHAESSISVTQVFSAAVLSLSDSWSQHRPFTSTHANLQASDLEATVVVLGGVVGARDHGALQSADSEQSGRSLANQMCSCCLTYGMQHRQLQIET